MVWASSPSITSPFLYFDGNTDITFAHRLEGSVFLAAAYSRVVLVAENGLETTIWSQGGFVTPTTTTVNTTVVGNYRIKFGWYALGLYADLDGGVDDIVTTATLVSPEVIEDTICPNDMNVIHEFGFPSNSATYYYDWNFVGTSGGTITPLTSNERKAQVDWTAGPGDYQMLAVEYSDASHTNCTGRETYFDIHVPSLPDVEITVDTVCEDEDFIVSLEFDGSGPWEMTYKIDGGVSQTQTYTNALSSISIPWGASTFEVTMLGDDGVCDRNTNLPSVNLYSYPGSTSGPIYHY